MRRKRLLVLGTTVPVTAGDGRPAFVLDLTRRLGEVHDVMILAPRVPGAPSTAVVDGVVVERFAYFPRRWERLADGAILPNIRNDPWLALQAPPLVLALLVATLRRVRRGRYDLVHAHWFVPAGVVAALCRLLTGVPYVVTGHGADVFALPGSVAAGLRRWVIRHAAFVGATSDDLRRSLGDTDGIPVVVAPMGVDVERIAGDVGALDPEPGRLLFVGRLADKKGVDTVIRALDGLPGTALVVAGDGPDLAALQRVAHEVGVDDRVRFLGRVDRSRLADELRRAQALLVPSRVAADGDMDTTPLVMSEAMSAGVPVIASSLGGLAASIDDGRTGLLVPPDDVERWRAAMRRAVEQPDELRAMGRAARTGIAGSALDLRTTAAAYLDAIAAVDP